MTVSHDKLPYVLQWIYYIILINLTYHYHASSSHQCDMSNLSVYTGHKKSDPTHI